jgi:hypothetical protein
MPRIDGDINRVVASEIEQRRGGLSMERLAQEASAISGLPITRDVVVNILHCRSQPQLAVVDAIARVLGCTLAELVRPSIPCPSCSGTGRVAQPLEGAS